MVSLGIVAVINVVTQRLSLQQDSQLLLLAPGGLLRQVPEPKLVGILRRLHGSSYASDRLAITARSPL